MIGVLVEADMGVADLQKQRRAAGGQRLGLGKVGGLEQAGGEGEQGAGAGAQTAERAAAGWVFHERPPSGTGRRPSAGGIYSRREIILEIIPCWLGPRRG